ncbi:hypothetical protein [Bacillus sp. Au-Bac7]|uniref:hypothetical protein n=1 Tax=Bacillus sp. Au-Bac7 TaxID=2906458 RepID=UPI001E396785|nr:hypothetical protein [Bacillus sp. Au-Bac7]MCE4049797.1 hypothetical protein [Bacillus sp. Au-Bac7]
MLPPLHFMFVGRLRKYRGIKAQTVAAAMSKLAAENKSGVHILESDEIERRA